MSEILHSLLLAQLYPACPQVWEYCKEVLVFCEEVWVDQRAPIAYPNWHTQFVEI